MRILDNQIRAGEHEQKSLLEDIRKTIAKVMHPTINKSLMCLGMTRDIDLKGNVASLTLLIPFPGIPILPFLENSLKESVNPLGINLKINIELMNEEGIQHFLTIEKKVWKD